jgi:hypothetical protein
MKGKDAEFGRDRSGPEERRGSRWSGNGAWVRSWPCSFGQLKKQLPEGVDLNLQSLSTLSISFPPIKSSGDKRLL